jgi:hypothetical protein
VSENALPISERLAESTMRALLAVLIFVSGLLAVSSTVEAARKSKRATEPRYYHPVPPRRDLREQLLCEERAQNEDPSGQFKGYPCWAREIFGRGSGQGGRGR